VFPRDALYGERIHGHGVQAGIEALGSARNACTIFREERIKETNLRIAIFDDSDSTICNRATVCEAGVAFETTVVRKP